MNRICRFGGKKLPGPALKVTGTDRIWRARGKYHQISNRSAARRCEIIGWQRRRHPDPRSPQRHRRAGAKPYSHDDRRALPKAKPDGAGFDRRPLHTTRVFPMVITPNDLQWSTQYALYSKPHIVIGHRFRLLDFQKQSGSGYFDPNNYIANRGFASSISRTRLLRLRRSVSRIRDRSALRRRFEQLHSWRRRQRRHQTGAKSFP